MWKTSANSLKASETKAKAEAETETEAKADAAAKALSCQLPTATLVENYARLWKQRHLKREFPLVLHLAAIRS